MHSCSRVHTVSMTQARRAQKAQIIIRKAYGIDRRRVDRVALRYELLGDSVALAVVRELRRGDVTVIKVARQLPDGRVVRMLKECRAGFASVKDQVKYYEALYQRYGEPG